jgi:hypothetical protein
MLWKRGNGKIKTLEQTKPQRHRCDIHSSNPYIAATSMVSTPWFLDEQEQQIFLIKNQTLQKVNELDQRDSKSPN